MARRRQGNKSIRVPFAVYLASSTVFAPSADSTDTYGGQNITLQMQGELLNFAAVFKQYRILSGKFQFVPSRRYLTTDQDKAGICLIKQYLFDAGTWATAEGAVEELFPGGKMVSADDRFALNLDVADRDWHDLEDMVDGRNLFTLNWAILQHNLAANVAPGLSYVLLNLELR